MSWCFEDEDGEYARSILRQLKSSEAIVPAVWPLEVGNALLMAERRGRIQPAEIAQFLDILRGLPIAVEQESTERMLTEIFGLAKDCSLSTYDASYLDLAMRSGIPLATQDKLLAKAARRTGVQLLRPKSR